MESILSITIKLIFLFILVFIIRKIYNIYLLQRDRKRVFRYLYDNISAYPKSLTRSTRTIAANAQLSKERVQFICAKDDRLIEIEPDSWGIKVLLSKEKHVASPFSLQTEMA